jgi:ABC-type branched-subunit amino acid transport system ATPase component
VTAAADGLLVARGLAKSFGGVKAVNDVSMSVDGGEILGLIGPNGAGKSTLINLLTGLFSTDRGSVMFVGEDVTSMGPERRTRRGLLRTFQQLRAFRTFTVAESLAVASRAPRAKAERKVAAPDAIGEAAEQFGLADVMQRRVGELAYGLQKIVNLALVSLSYPQVLLLDEPFAGVIRDDVLRLSEIIRGFAARGVGICLVEHDMEAVMQTCGRIVVLDAGALIFEGTPEAVRKDPEVRRIYLGTAAPNPEAAGEGPR